MPNLLASVGNSFRHCICILAALLVSLAPVGSMAAERKNTRPVLDPPPPAMPQKITVARGNTVDIPLKIFGSQSSALRYSIKSGPAHGKLSELRPVSREAWTVTYEPPADLAVKADRFSFSVQNHTGVSAPVDVTISIVDEPPRLAVPHTIEFPETLAGQTAVQEIEIANRGGGVVSGEVEVDPPFRVEGRKAYRLEGGDFAYFKITFAPTEGGLFRREIRYTSEREFVTSVIGTSQAPISVEPAVVELRGAPNSALRTSGFEILNRTSQELTFTLKSSSRLQTPASITVAAQGRAAVAVSTRAEDVAAIDEPVRIESPGFAVEVPVRGIKVGPILRTAARSVTLGRAEATRGTQASVELQNIGGTVARITAEIAPPFSLSETKFDLTPGGNKRLTLSIQPSEPQRYRAWLKFRTSTSTTEIEVDADLFGEGGAMAAGSEDPAKSGKKSANPATLEPWAPDLNIAKAIRVTQITSSSANLEWPIDFNGAARFRVDRLMLTRDSARRMVHAWVEVPRTTFTRQGTQWVAALAGLGAQQSQTVRVVPLGADGKPGAELFRLDFYTQPQKSLPKPKTLHLLFVALFATIAIIVWKRVRRQFGAPLSGF